MQLLVEIDMRLQRQRGIEHCLHLFLAMALERHFDGMRARGRLFKDVAAGHVHEFPKQVIILGKVRMTQYMQANCR